MVLGAEQEWERGYCVGAAAGSVERVLVAWLMGCVLCFDSVSRLRYLIDVIRAES